MRAKPIFWWWLIPVLLAVFWLGARSLDARPVWADERRSVLDSFGSFWGPGSFDDIWDEVARKNPWHSPGYFFALHEWGQAVGWEPPALRTLSLLVALVAVAMTYRVGAELFSARVGLFAALVLASSAFFVHYSFELRVYTIMALLSIATFWVYSRLIFSRKPALILWPALFLCVVGLLYSHYLAAITLVGIGLYHLIFAPKNRRWLAVVGVVAAGGLTFVPWVRYMLEGIELAIDKDELNARALPTPQAFVSFLSLFGNGFIVLMLVLIGVALRTLRGSGRAVRNTRLLFVVAAGALIAVLAVNHVLQIMHSGRLRYLIPLWPLFALIIGLGVAQLRRWRPLMAGVMALWVGVGLWNTLIVNFTIDLDGADYVYPIQHIARAIRPYVEPDDTILAYSPSGMDTTKENILEFYFRAMPVPVEYVAANDDSTEGKRKGQIRELLERFENTPRVWVGYPAGNTPLTLSGFQQAMTGSFDPCDWASTEPEVVIELYVRKGLDCPTETAG